MYKIPDLKGKEIIMYLRKSRSDDPLASVEEVLENHEQMLDDWMALNMPNGGKVPMENRYKEVVSGETLSGRPWMKKLLRAVESPDVKAVLCKEPSRLSRGRLKDIGYIVEVLMYTKTLVLTPSECYDLQDDRDRERFERELMRGNDYLEYQKKILRDGKLLAVKNGNFIGERAPYGYRKISYKDGRHTCRTLEPHPEEAPVVKRIFELYRSGLGSVHICEALDAEHAPTRTGAKWSHNTVLRVLNNEHYLGMVRWNYSQRVHKVEEGEIKSARTTTEKYLLFKGKHPALISQEDWDAVHAIKGKISRKRTVYEFKNTLASLLYCSCGKPMQYKEPKHKGVQYSASRVICGDLRNAKCGSAKFEEILDEVKQVLQDCIEDFEVQIDDGVDNSAEVYRQHVERLEKRLESLQDLEVKQWDEKTRGGMPDHVFERLNAKTVAEIREVTQALCEAKDSAPVHVDLREKLITFRTALEMLNDPDAPALEVNQLLRTCIDRIDYSRPPLKRGRGVVNEPFSLHFSLRV
jgi:hypothetical protein